MWSMMQTGYMRLWEYMDFDGISLIVIDLGGWFLGTEGAGLERIVMVVERGFG